MPGYYFAVRELAEDHGDNTFYKLARRLSLTDSRARQLWNGVKKMADDTVTLICDGYNCTPNDLLRRRAEPAKAVRRSPRKAAAGTKAT